MRVFIFFRSGKSVKSESEFQFCIQNSEAGGVMKPSAVARGAMKLPAGAVRFYLYYILVHALFSKYSLIIPKLPYTRFSFLTKGIIFLLNIDHMKISHGIKHIDKRS